MQKGWVDDNSKVKISQSRNLIGRRVVTWHQTTNQILTYFAKIEDVSRSRVCEIISPETAHCTLGGKGFQYIPRPISDAFDNVKYFFCIIQIIEKSIVKMKYFWI